MDQPCQGLSGGNMSNSQKQRKTSNPVAEAYAACRSAFFNVGTISLFINLLMLTGPLFMLQVYDRVLASRSIPTLVALTVLVVVL